MMTLTLITLVRLIFFDFPAQGQQLARSGGCDCCERVLVVQAGVGNENGDCYVTIRSAIPYLVIIPCPIPYRRCRACP
jgi:hypothetical protein